ncbi:MAG: hypothetical protein JSU73_10945 [candidate division WOR-3 bacterium]|nr:MAG: hypothetical protein JSU73_10945 [candidate division WOR-3 bacterium]
MREIEGSPGTVISDVDADGIEQLDLEDKLCFRCRLLEDPRRPRPSPGECLVRAADLLPLVRDSRSGIKVVTRSGRILAYAVFGRAKLFRNLADSGLPAAEDALLIGALFANDEARDENLDIDLLVAVMDFAREHGYEIVQAVCRADDEEENEFARQAMLSAAGFDIGDPVGDFCLAQIGVEQWDSPSDTEAEE